MKAKTFIAKSLLLALVACSSTPSKSELDAEVRRLCAIDGGIKVYETVGLPADKFNEYGQINFYRATQGENALGPEYSFVEEIRYYQSGNPELWRSLYRVIRRSDGKTLGESIGYSRRGGDALGPWHESSYGCSQEYGDTLLLKRIFLK
ncbi:hypothetical protein B9N43_04860 [Denitratisoma sp. DHT3]|uniref:hypothetical protein n=1 Tax=Denitratisoma sp. DHT3 TaxID=1981880 RepID=UPI00119862E1|nr:hypothetical protein [Denitratisoma sp. DHT3]QDX80633.1 hypothetical protein B9N43_04860 [Denitratisoma sp. DHT3]